MLQNSLARIWFLSQGCKQVPPDEVGGKILWAHPDGYFLNAHGQKVMHNFSPRMTKGYTATNPTSGGNTGGCYPIMRRFGGKNCHSLMALAFYGERPTYTDKSGKPYVGICHHLIPDKLDYRPANLLCWLTREQHAEADRRQRLLKRTVEDLHTLGYGKLRILQDPRVTSQEDFAKTLSLLIDRHPSDADIKIPKEL